MNAYVFVSDAVRDLARLDRRLKSRGGNGSRPHGLDTRYKSLADIERGFRVFKSEIEIAPAYHR